MPKDRTSEEQADAVSEAEGIFRERGGTLRTMDAIRHGIHPRTLYELRDSGRLEQLSRGLYRLAELPPLSDPDVTTVAARAPGGVICLLSALAFHDITTQIPHEVHLALRRGAAAPRIDHPPIRVFWFSDKAFEAGIETHQLDGIPIRVYSATKTAADCFKYRNKLGLDVALEALQLYLRRRDSRTDDLVAFARVCRVERVMRPYIEALL